MNDDILKLITTSQRKDRSGVIKTVPAKRIVLCKSDSVSMTEYFEGGRNGLRPDMRFIVFPGDYRGETEVEFHGNVYGVYRTYQRDNDTLELYVQRKGGLKNG